MCGILAFGDYLPSRAWGDGGAGPKGGGLEGRGCAPKGGASPWWEGTLNQGTLSELNGNSNSEVTGIGYNRRPRQREMKTSGRQEAKVCGKGQTNETKSKKKIGEYCPGCGMTTLGICGECGEGRAAKSTHECS